MISTDAFDRGLDVSRLDMYGGIRQLMAVGPLAQEVPSLFFFPLIDDV
nr:hypothetical protein [Halosolutus halophilus]